MSELRDAKALSQVTSELREEPLPALDWDGIEERLMEQAKRAPAGSDRTSLPWGLALGALAAAAGVALWLGANPGARPPIEPPATPPGSLAAAVNGDELGLGESILAGSEPVRIEHAGRAVWTLSPDSRAHIAARGRFLTVALEQGSVLAEVVSGQAAESFAIEAHQTRVAAHGTVFHVTLLDSQVEVRVTEGEVVVGSAEDRGNTRGFHLTAPGHGTFALDGARVGRISPPSRDDEASSTRPGALLPPAPPAAANREPPKPITSAQPETPQGPTAEMVADHLVEKLRGCFVQHTHVHGSVHVSATSTLSVTFLEGAVEQVHLEPPLAPDVEQCTREAAQTAPVILNAGAQTVIREVWLSR
jgi:hypothetical protein